MFKKDERTDEEKEADSKIKYNTVKWEPISMERSREIVKERREKYDRIFKRAPNYDR